MIYHIAHKKEWIESKKIGTYKTDSLINEGFIHCSPLGKIEETGKKFFKDHNGLLILCIDEKKVISNIIWEDLYHTDLKFPHIYGKLNVDAVLQVVDFEVKEKGKFNLPQNI